MSNDIIRCKYAGDPGDEYCCSCDGYNPIDDNGNPQVATECGGYEPADEVNEQPAHEPTPSHSETAGEQGVNNDDNKQPIVGITNVIRAESGVSCEINGAWYKFMFSEERILPEGCDIEAEKQALWESVNAQVDAQVDAVRN